MGLPVLFEGAVYNTAALACDGRLLGIVAKQHLAGDGIHYEPRWFRRWQPGEVGEIEIDGASVPFGDLLFDVGDVRIGFEICRDAWVADRTGARLAQRGADILLNPSASHFAFAKQDVRERFVLEGSRAFCVSYAYANLLGQRIGPGDLRRRHAHRQRRQDARSRAPVLVRRLAADDGDRRRDGDAAGKDGVLRKVRDAPGQPRRAGP